MASEITTFVARVLRLVLTLLVIGVLLNDGIRVGSALSRVAGGLNAATAAATDVVSADPFARERAGSAAAEAAAARLTTLDTYEQTSGESGGTLHVRVSLTVSTRVTGTVVAAPILGLIEGIEPAEWYADTGARIALGQSKQVDLIGSASP